MGLQITLRNSSSLSPFKHQLELLCTIPNAGDIVLCSAYVWEDVKGNSILAAGVQASLASVHASGGSVVCVAGKLTNSGGTNWDQFYRDFVKNIHKSGIAVTAWSAPQRNWHAKIAIRLDKSGVPLAAIVGSSNLTHPAYAEPHPTWNYECDVTIYLPQIQSHFTNKLASSDGSPSPITTVLDPTIAQPDESSRLRELLDQVFADKSNFVSVPTT